MHEMACMHGFPAYINCRTQPQHNPETPAMNTEIITDIEYALHRAEYPTYLFTIFRASTVKEADASALEHSRAVCRHNRFCLQRGPAPTVGNPTPRVTIQKY